MTVENPLATTPSNLPTSLADIANLPAVPNEADSELKSSNILPKLSLMTPTSKDVTEERCVANVFALKDAAENCDNLGKEVLIVPIAFRPLAIDMSDPKVTKFYYNFKSNEYQDVKAKAKAAKGLSEYLAGPQFLVWIPSRKAFALYYMSSWSSQLIADSLNGMKGQPVMLTMFDKFSKSTQKNYKAPKITLSTEVVDPQPTPEELQAVLTDFMNPRDSSQETGEAVAESHDR